MSDRQPQPRGDRPIEVCPDCGAKTTTGQLSIGGWWWAVCPNHGRVDLPAPPDRRPDERLAGGGSRVYRPDGAGCVERVHPTELAMDDYERFGP